MNTDKSIDSRVFESGAHNIVCDVRISDKSTSYHRIAYNQQKPPMNAVVILMIKFWSSSLCWNFPQKFDFHSKISSCYQLSSSLNEEITSWNEFECTWNISNSLFVHLTRYKFVHRSLSNMIFLFQFLIEI